MLKKVQSDLPVGCSCYNGTDGIFPRKCNAPGCSRGNNNDCNSVTVYFGNNYRIRFLSGAFDIHGCNCPGFSYNGGSSTGKNGVYTTTTDTPISTYYHYTNCSEIGAGGNAIACCMFCCTSP
ncbi:unnamed protein product [Adineta ricciae]|nr:unnamed protein product [Adineta ricciae]